jgi:hypothetical protein
MPLTSSTQAQIAFKNLLGKSQTKVNNGIVNEPYGISFDIPSKNVWLDTIYASSSTTIVQGSTVMVTADLVTIPGADNYAFFTKWPSLVPSGSDIQTGLPFQYGNGSLTGITGGDRMYSIISDSFSSEYEAKPFAGLTAIPVLDDRNWVYQYNSGIFYQDNITSAGTWTYTTPTKIIVYPYIGSKMANLNTQQNIRLTAFGTNSYYATASSPIISTYSSNYLYLVDFLNSNTSGTVSLNINNIGTVSIVQYNQSGLVNLLPNDITGATGSTAGSIYYLTYNNGSFQFFKTNPLQTSSNYSNPIQTLYDVGNVNNGTTFDNVLIQDVFSDLFYSEQLGNINSFNLIGMPTTLEVGTTISSSSSLTFSWILSNTSSFSENTSSIVYSGYGDLLINATNSTNTFEWITPINLVNNTPDSETFIFSIKRDNGTTIRETLSIDWKWKIYYGSSTYTALDAPDIVSLSGNTLSSTSSIILSVTGSGYKYIGFPNDSSFLVNNITYKNMPIVLCDYSEGYTYSNNDIGYKLLSLTNSNGIGKEYKIYRTVNKISGTLSLNIN